MQVFFKIPCIRAAWRRRGARQGNSRLFVRAEKPRFYGKFRVFLIICKGYTRQIREPTARRRLAARFLGSKTVFFILSWLFLDK